MILRTGKAKLPSCRNALPDESGGESLASQVTVSNLAKQSLWDNWSCRQWLVENARGRSSCLLRFCSMSGKPAMNMPEEKFTERLKDHFEYYNDTAKRIDGKRIQFIFHVFLWEKVLKNRWMESTRLRRRLTTVHSRNLSSSSYFHGNDERTQFRFVQKGRKKVMGNFCKTRKEMQLTSESSSPGTSWRLVQVQTRLGHLKGTQTTHKESGMIWQIKVRMCILQKKKKTSKFERVKKPSKRESWSEGGENMHFDASEQSKKMMMDLISSVNDTCMLYRICDYLGQIKKGRSWKSPRFGFNCSYSKSLGHCQFVSSICCRPLGMCLVSRGTHLSTSINSWEWRIYKHQSATSS